MDTAAVRTAYDDQVRHRAGPGCRVEHGDGVIRSAGAWNGIGWSALHPDRADAVIAAQVARFRELGRTWEWKHHSHDALPDLPGRLLAAGFVAGEPEALLVAEAAALRLDATPPDGVGLVPVVDAAGVDALVAVHDAVFGGDHSAVGRTLRTSDDVEAVLAVADGVPVSAGRIEFVPGTEFAGLWGGGTRREWRGRGIFRALVAFRAARAVERGYRYLQVDATADSRPILLRLGFTELATTTPYLHD